MDLSRMPEETAKDYQEHPHYYHAVVAGAVALPVTATAATATGIALGIYATAEGIRDHVNDRHPLP